MNQSTTQQQFADRLRAAVATSGHRGRRGLGALRPGARSSDLGFAERLRRSLESR